MKLRTKRARMWFLAVLGTIFLIAFASVGMWGDYGMQSVAWAAVIVAGIYALCAVIFTLIGWAMNGDDK